MSLEKLKVPRNVFKKIRSSLVYLVSLGFFYVCIVCVSCKYWDKDYWKVVGRWKEGKLCSILSKCGLREREKKKKRRKKETRGMRRCFSISLVSSTDS